MLSTVSIVCDSLFRDPTILWFYEKYFCSPGSLPRSCVLITLQAPGWESVMNFILKFTIHFEALRRWWGGPSLMTQMVKNLPAMLETRVQSLGQEDPLEKRMATHSSILAWRIPWTEDPGGLQSMGGGHNESDTTERLTPEALRGSPTLKSTPQSQSTCFFSISPHP